MPELKKFPVFGERGRIGTLTAAARFLDSRSERMIELENGGQISVPADALKVQPDGSFFLSGAFGKTAAPAPEPDVVEDRRIVEDPPPEFAPAAAAEQIIPAESTRIHMDINRGQDGNRKMFRDGYSIETVKVGRIVSEAPPQRQEGDTLVLPVVEEVLVTEKRLLLREEIRITRRREEVEQIQTVDPSTA